MNLRNSYAMILTISKSDNGLYNIMTLEVVERLRMLQQTCSCSPSDISSSVATVPMVLRVEYVVVVTLDGLLVTLASLGPGSRSNFMTGMSASVP